MILFSPDSIVQTAAIITALIIIWKFDKMVLRNAYKFIKFIAHWIHLVFSLPGKISHIEHEMTANGGNSMKDIVSDVDKRLRMVENKIHISEGKTKIILSATDSLAWELDKDGKCIWVSSALARLLNRQLEEILGDNWKSLIVNDQDKEIYMENRESAIIEGRVFESNVKLLKAGGEIVRMSVQSFPIKAEDNVVLGWFGTGKLLHE